MSLLTKPSLPRKSARTIRIDNPPAKAVFRRRYIRSQRRETSGRGELTRGGRTRSGDPAPHGRLGGTRFGGASSTSPREGEHRFRFRRGTIVAGRRGCRIGAIVPIVEIIRDIVAVSQAGGVFRTEDVRLTQAETGGLADIRALAVVACPRRIRPGGHEPDRNEHGGEDGESATKAHAYHSGPAWS